MVSKTWEKVAIHSECQERERKRLESIKKKYAEQWQENETSIVIKMLHESILSNDDERVQALQRSLLDLERKSDKDMDDDGLPNSLPSDCIPIKAKSFTSSALSHHTGSTGESAPNDLLCFSPTEADYLNKAMQQNMKQYEAQINVMVVGNSMTGKTSLMHSMLGQKVPLQLRHTTGYRYTFTFTFRIDSGSAQRAALGKKIKYKVFDSDGERNNEFIRKGIVALTG